MIWHHYSIGEVRHIDLRNKGQARDANCKPDGFWITPPNQDDNWEAWCVGEGWRCGHLTHVHEVEIDETTLLCLGSAESLDWFTAKYGNGPRWNTYIKWKEVALEYKGILITPYIWDRRLHDGSFWYYGWDCASGCVWDVSAIKDVRLIDVREETEILRRYDSDGEDVQAA